MTDKKITQITENTAIDDTDLFVAVQNVSTTPVTRAKTGALVKSWLKTYFDPLYSGASSGLPMNYITGLTLSNNVSDATNDINIAIGKCRNNTDAADMSLAGAITKRLDAAWVVGTNNGGLDQGSIANATYHIHLIKRVDTGVVDVIFSLSHDESRTATMTIATPAVVTMGVTGNGHGLVAGSPIKFLTTGALPTGVTAGTQYYVIAAGLTETAFEFSTSNGGSAVNTSGSQSGIHTCLPGPQLPTNYTLFRRIGSIVRVANAIKAFIQNGDQFNWSAITEDVNVTNPGTSAVTRTLTLPIGIRINSIVAVLGYGTGAANNPQGILLSDLMLSDMTPSSSIFSVSVYTALAGLTQLGVVANCFTNRSAQIRSRCQVSPGASTGLVIGTHGWIDTRGRN